jgi:hypothetical protein
MTKLFSRYRRRDVEAEPTRLLFVHTPRTAGIALHEALEKWARPTNTLRFTHGGREAWEELRRIPDDEIEHLRLISGHVGWNAFEETGRFDNWLAITVIRDPLQRILSLYSYATEWEYHPWHGRLRNASLSDYLDFLAEDQFNMDSQCRMIADQRSAAAALEKLTSRFFLAASLENLNLMLAKLSRRLGTTVAMKRVNESAVRIDPHGLPSPILERIRIMNAQDAILYERVRDAGLVGWGAIDADSWPSGSVIEREGEARSECA